MNERLAKSRSMDWKKRRSSTSPVKQMPRRTLMVVLSKRVASHLRLLAFSIGQADAGQRG
jgi:hypothetical protein